MKIITSTFLPCLCFHLWLLLGSTSVAELSGSVARAAEAVATRPPLPDRIVSFHQGRADFKLIQLASQAGYNGVQIQTEGGTVKPLEKFAAYNEQTQIIAKCHALGMQVSVWVHELNDLPEEFLLKPGTEPLKPGQVLCNYRFAGSQKIVIDLNDPKLWELLDLRYERILTKLIPEIDALVLTVTETQVHATNPELFIRLIQFLNEKCKKHGKQLHVRTFVWHPEDLNGLMETVRQLSSDVVIMSKCVPQDWHLRSINALELGQVGQHQQIEEWDVAGEYFGLNKWVNCMPELLQRQLDYGLSQGIQGICVRVDRGDQSVLHQPSEVNLWALGLLASGRAATLDQVWKTWATNRYGLQAGLAVIPILRHTTDIVQQALYIENFSFFDPRRPLGAAGETDPFKHNANPHNWSDQYKPIHDRLVQGDPAAILQLETNNLAASQMASNSLASLERNQALFKPADYAQLRKGLLVNQTQLAWRGAMHLAYLRHRLLTRETDSAKRAELTSAIRQDLQSMRAIVANADPTIPADGNQALKWAGEMESLLR